MVGIFAKSGLVVLEIVMLFASAFGTVQNRYTGLLTIPLKAAYQLDIISVC